MTTEQAPQSPSAQPSLAPVRPDPRRYSSSVVLGETPSRRTLRPLRINSMALRIADRQTVVRGRAPVNGIRGARAGRGAGCEHHRRAPRHTLPRQTDSDACIVIWQAASNIGPMKLFRLCLAAGGLLSALPGAIASETNLYIRLNQIGYRPADPKIAVAFSTEPVGPVAPDSVPAICFGRHGGQRYPSKELSPRNWAKYGGQRMRPCMWR